MRIAVTGASGFLGRALVREAEAGAHELTLLGRDAARLKETFGAAPHRLEATDYSRSSLSRAVRGCEALVHLAARRHEPGEAHIEAYLENILFTENALLASEEAGVPLFIFASTRAVYTAGVDPLPFREETCVSPRHPYAISKRVGEMLGARSRLRFAALRFAQLVGPGEREGFLVATFLRNGILGLPLTVFGDGGGGRDYLYVRDAAQAILRVCEQPHASGIFNIGSGVETSALEFAEAVRAELSKDRSEIRLDPTRPADPMRCRLDITRAREVLGWSPRFTLREALADMRGALDAAGGPA